MAHSLLFFDLHLIAPDLDGKDRCIRCGMTAEEIIRFETPMHCPVSETRFTLRARMGFDSEMRKKYSAGTEETVLENRN